MRLSTLLGLAASASSVAAAVLNPPETNSTATSQAILCPADSDAQYDYIIGQYAVRAHRVCQLKPCHTTVGAGAGGGPVASRLALAGFKVLLVDAGHDVVDTNTTVPFYFARSNEGESGSMPELEVDTQRFSDPQISVSYYADLYAPGNGDAVKNWYPRASAMYVEPLAKLVL